jgi:transcriptional regulator of arginine metabolism
MTDAPSAGQAVPQTRTARHRRIVDILNRQPVRSQSQLAKMLADDGLTVTQATLSRDLDELGAVKIRNSGGELIYAVPSEGGFRTPMAPLGESVKEERMARLAADLASGAWDARHPGLRERPELDVGYRLVVSSG